MKRITIIGFLGMWGLMFFSLAGCSTLNQANAGESPIKIDESPVGSPDMTAAPSCANPTPEMIARCRAQAERVLASTVRIEFHGPGGGIGHGTIFGGRYLITHNHFPVSGEALGRGGDGVVSAVSVYKANGNVVLLKAPLSYFSVVHIAPEALVLDFREYSGVGFFDSVGVPSVEMSARESISVQPGSEVAQIDWDMSTAHVTWVRVTAVHVEGNTPYIELDSLVEQGASGGGVFYNGYHIANNWSRNTDRQAETGEILRQYSIAALNTSSLNISASEVASVGN